MSIVRLAHSLADGCCTYSLHCTAYEEVVNGGEGRPSGKLTCSMRYAGNKQKVGRDIVCRQLRLVDQLRREFGI